MAVAQRAGPPLHINIQRTRHQAHHGKFIPGKLLQGIFRVCIGQLYCPPKHVLAPVIRIQDTLILRLGQAAGDRSQPVDAGSNGICPEHLVIAVYIHQHVLIATALCYLHQLLLRHVENIILGKAYGGHDTVIVKVLFREVFVHRVHQHGPADAKSRKQPHAQSYDGEYGQVSAQAVFYFPYCRCYQDIHCITTLSALRVLDFHLWSPTLFFRSSP